MKNFGFMFLLLFVGLAVRGFADDNSPSIARESLLSGKRSNTAPVDASGKTRTAGSPVSKKAVTQPRKLDSSVFSTSKTGSIPISLNRSGDSFSGSNIMGPTRSASSSVSSNSGYVGDSGGTKFDTNALVYSKLDFNQLIKPRVDFNRLVGDKINLSSFGMKFDFNKIDLNMVDFNKLDPKNIQAFKVDPKQIMMKVLAQLIQQPKPSKEVLDMIKKLRKGLEMYYQAKVLMSALSKDMAEHSDNEDEKMRKLLEKSKKFLDKNGD